MASPQKENGYTAIANEIMEAVAKVRLNGSQHSILLAVWRYTYGFQKCEHKLAISFLAEATNLQARVVRKELKTLFERRILLETKGYAGTRSRVIKFNKDYDQWLEGCKNTSLARGVQIYLSSEVQTDPSRGVQLDPQYRKKKTIKKYSDDSTEMKIAKYMFGKILDMNPTYKSPNWQTWCKDIGLTREKDKRPDEDLKDVIDWVFDHHFWKTVILSPGKLRSKYDDLNTKRMKEPPKKRGAPLPWIPD